LPTSGCYRELGVKSFFILSSRQHHIKIAPTKKFVDLRERSCVGPKFVLAPAENVQNLTTAYSLDEDPRTV
jgi:hypothetical protein